MRTTEKKHPPPARRYLRHAYKAKAYFKKTWNKAIQLCDGLTFLLHHMQMHECWMLCVWVCFVVYTWVLSKYESALATWAKAKWIICLFVSDNCDFFFIYARLSSPCFCFLSLPSSWKHTWFVFFSLLSFVWHNPRLKYAFVACARFAIYRVYRVSVILIFSMFCFFVWRCAWWHLYCPFRFFFLFILLNHITIDSTIFFYKLWFHCQ